MLAEILAGLQETHGEGEGTDDEGEGTEGEIESLLEELRREDGGEKKVNEKVTTVRELIEVNWLVDRDAAVEIMKDSKAGHVHIFGRHGSGKSDVVSRIVSQHDRNVTKISPIDNKNSKADILVPLINKLKITDNAINRFRGTKENAIQLISETLSNDAIVVIEDIENGTKPRGNLHLHLIFLKIRFLILQIGPLLRW